MVIRKLRRAIRHLKWTRAEGRLTWGGSAALAASGFLLKQPKLIPEVVPYREWAAPALFLMGAALILSALVKLWRLTLAPPAVLDLEGTSLRGAAAFAPEDGEVFKRLGRHDELRKLRGWIQDDQVPLVVVKGESGVGKTSLLRAGVQNLVEDVAYWEAEATESMRSFIRAVRSQLGQAPESLERGVILIDQTEQLGADPELFEALRKHLKKGPPFDVTWILAMRNEYVSEWIDWSQDLEESIRRRAQVFLTVKHLSIEEAKSVFSILAEEARLTVREEVQKEVLSAITEDDRVSPVDLAIALQVLARHPRHAEDPRFLISVGGHNAMLTSYLENELEIYDEWTRGEICRALLELIDLEKDRRKATGISMEALAEVAQPVSWKAFLHAFERLALPTVRVLERCGEEKDRLRLVHERFIPAVRRVSGAVLSMAEQASRLFSRRYSLWAQEVETQKFLLVGKELREVERELSRIQWGQDREGKERFLRLSKERRQRLRTVGAVGLILTAAGLWWGYEALNNRNDRYRMRSWGLPDGLYEVLPRVRSLSLKEPITDLRRWIQRAQRLESLNIINGRNLRNLKSLKWIPNGVSQLALNLSYSSVSSLKGIPEDVSNLSLSLSHSPVSSLEGIPDGVSKLSLGFNDWQDRNLEGIPDGVSQLTLNLSRTRVKSLHEIPDGVSRLNLYLSFSQVSCLEWIPDGVSKLTLDLSYTRVGSLEGIPDGVSQLTLDLSDSQVKSLEGIPDGVSQLTLDLSDSQVKSLEGIPDSVSQLTLDLSDSQVSSLEGIPDGVSQLTLDLRTPRVRSLEWIPDGVSRLTLDLTFSQVGSLERIPESVSQLTLDLSDSQVKRLEGIPDGVSQLTLDLSDSQVSSLDGIPDGISQLNLKLNSLEEIPEDVSQLILDFSYSQVSNLKGIPAGVSQITLDLSYSQVSNLKGIPAGVSQLALDLSDSQVSSLEGIPEGVSHLTLDLRSSRVRSLDGIPDSVSKLTLDLSDSQVSSLEGIPDGTILDLSL